MNRKALTPLVSIDDFLTSRFFDLTAVIKRAERDKKNQGRHKDHRQGHINKKGHKNQLERGNKALNR